MIASIPADCTSLWRDPFHELFIFFHTYCLDELGWSWWIESSAFRFRLTVDLLFDGFGCVLLLLDGSPAPDRLDFGMAAAYDSAEGVAILSGAGDDV